MRTNNKSGIYGSRTICVAIRIFMIGFFLTIPGCQDSAIIWSEESKSPDGHWTASARTEQYSGPGTANVQTMIYLKQVNGSQPQMEILSLSNESAYPPGITNVKMNWITPSHLEITYKGHANIDFQAIKCAGIDISVQDSSRKTTSIYSTQ